MCPGNLKVPSASQTRAQCQFPPRVTPLPHSPLPPSPSPYVLGGWNFCSAWTLAIQPKVEKVGIQNYPIIKEGLACVLGCAIRVFQLIFFLY